MKASDCNFTAFKMQTRRPYHEISVLADPRDGGWLRVLLSVNVKNS